MPAKTKAQIESENNILKDELQALKDMMKEMMTSQKTEQVNNEIDNESNDELSTTSESFSEYNDEVIDISPNTLIHVSSLFSGGMTLTGAHGKFIRFDRFGQKMPITFEDLNYACSNNRFLAEDGYFYIHNANAVKLLYLSDEYNAIIDAKSIEDIINLPNEDIEKIYKKVTKNIRASIIYLVIKGIQQNKPKYQDRNKIEFMSKLYGKDLEVMAKNLLIYNKQ